PRPNDGYRVLVDRIWPRGISKEKAQLTAWMKDVAPSTELRKWFDHQPERFAQFKLEYINELSSDKVMPYVIQLQSYALEDTLTLIYAARDEQHNHALVLKEFIEKILH